MAKGDFLRQPGVIIGDKAEPLTTTLSTCTDNLVGSITNEDKIVWAIRTLQPFKTAVPDGIIPALLQESLVAILP